MTECPKKRSTVAGSSLNPTQEVGGTSFLIIFGVSYKLPVFSCDIRGGISVHSWAVAPPLQVGCNVSAPNAPIEWQIASIACSLLATGWQGIVGGHPRPHTAAVGGHGSKNIIVSDPIEGG